MNRIIRHASVIGLLVLAVTIGANAQSAQQYRAEIPFSFDAAGKHYEAGKYSVGPVSQSSPGGIGIVDLQNRNVRVLGITSLQGDDNWDKPGRLTFVKTNGRYTLNQISTATFKMKVSSKMSKSGDLARGSSSNPEVVAIDLHR